MHSTVQYSRPADRGEGLVISRIKRHFRAIFSDFGRISCDFRFITDFGKKCEIKGNKENQGNLEAAVKGNSHGGLAGMRPQMQPTQNGR